MFSDHLQKSIIFDEMEVFFIRFLQKSILQIFFLRKLIEKCKKNMTRDQESINFVWDFHFFVTFEPEKFLEYAIREK